MPRLWEPATTAIMAHRMVALQLQPEQWGRRDIFADIYESWTGALTPYVSYFGKIF
jgi:hypothetical protein